MERSYRFFTEETHNIINLNENGKKMAKRPVKVCKLLCYLANKYGNIPNKSLISVIITFYTHEVDFFERCGNVEFGH